MKKNRSFILTSLLFSMILFSISGCLSVKSDYPEIKYYQLNQEPSTFNNTGNIDGTLQIREFSISEQLDIDQIVAVWDNSRIQKYYYHRWLTPCPELVTDFFINRYNTYNAFKKGVLKSRTIVIPDYILEGQILDMVAHNSEKNISGNSAFISIQINLIKRTQNQSERKIIFSKVFTSSVQRSTNEASNIADAFSKAVSQIADKILIDIQESIIYHKNNTDK